MAVGSAAAEALASLVLPLSPSGGDATGTTAEEEGPLELTSPLAWAVVTSEVETCGVPFVQHLIRARAIQDGGGMGGAGKGRRKGRPGAEEEGEEELEGGEGEDEDETFRFPKNMLTERDVEKMDYYELLGLGHVAMRCSADLIKKAYRKALLLYHPDKTGRGDRDAVFIAVQKAYETLSDERKRRAYDSEMDFDESIPTGRERGDFFKIYAPVFDRNARFAVKRPVPPLGDLTSEIEDVYRFYEYWSRFESWRDFALKAAEYNVEEAGSREEKRWMQKENDKRARSLKKEEYKRLATLVDRAKQHDPRIKNAREAEKLRKEQAKAKREAERRAREEAEKKEKEAEERRRGEEEARLKEERAQAKALKDAGKKRMRAVRSRFRALCKLARETEGTGALPAEDEDFLYEVLDVEGMEAALTALGGTFDLEQLLDASASPPPLTLVPGGMAAVAAIVEGERGKAQAKQREEEEAKEKAREQDEAAAAAAAQQAKKEREWSEEELGLLAKAVIRFPAGTQKRWQCIADYINHMLRLQEPRGKEECIRQYQVVQATPQKSAHEPGIAKAASSSAASSSGGGTAAAGTGAGAAKVKVEAGGEAEDGWTQEQQKQLEAGLVKHPASMEKNERWKAIAEGVQGKTKKQCIERYKALRAALQQKKAAATSGGAGSGVRGI